MNLAQHFPFRAFKTSSDTYWRPMRYFNIYRIVIASFLLSVHFTPESMEWWHIDVASPYFQAALIYWIFSMAVAAMAEFRRPGFDQQVSIQAIGDILLMTMLMHTAGGVRSGLGLLIVIAIVGAALVSQGRLALFYAAIATIALLAENSVQLLSDNETYAHDSQTVMLGLSCFATAWLAYTLGKRMRQSEALASQRGVDLENLSQVNQLIIQDMQDGVLVVDDTLTLRHHNGRAEELLGNGLMASTSMALANCAPEVAQLMRTWIAKEEEHRSGVARLLVHDKELRLRFQPIGLSRRSGAVVFIEDWSRIQAQARQLKLAALGALTANIAHEIRNPLSSISHASQLLQEESLAPSLQRLLRIIHDNTLRLDKIVQDVMQINQRDRIQQEPIFLPDFIHEFYEQFCITEHIPANAIVTTIALPNATALFDRQQLNRVLWNLCRNGWRHCQQQAGSLQLRLDKAVRQGEIMLEILDDGPGIPAESRQRLFEPFFTTEKTGTGLGLYIARELCEANGAGLRYIDGSGGARFRIYLKLHHE
jgi:two-component system sensor histidine kinase PilS (NtrC family)